MSDISIHAETSLDAVGTATLIMGDSGSGKTDLLVTFADYIWRKFGKITLYYSVDSGGFGNRMKARAQKGIVWIWRVKSRDPDDEEGLGMETCARAAQGYWPKEIDPTTGKCPKGVDLMPPTIHKYEVACPKCGIVMIQTNSRQEIQSMGELYCNKDSLTVNMRNAVIKHESYRTPGMEQVGAVAIDGLTSMADWPMADLAKRGATPTETGENRNVRGSSQAIQSGMAFFGTSSMAHYSFAHLQAESWLRDANEIAGLVHPPLWTALEKRGQEGDTKLPIYGPDIPGTAKTAKIPQWVGNCLGTTVTQTPQGKEWRLYLTEYRDGPGEPPHLCKTRVGPGFLPEFLSDGPTDDHGMPLSGSPAYTKFNLGYYFDQESAALLKEFDSLGDLGDTPGLPSGRLGTTEEPTQLVAVEQVKDVVPVVAAAAVSTPAPEPQQQVLIPVAAATPQAASSPSPDGNTITPPAGKRPVPPAAAAPRPK